MSEHEIIEKTKGKQGILAKIQNFLTLGYGIKEDIREQDKKLRNLYYIELQNMRHKWEDVYLRVLDSGIKVSNRDLKKILQNLDIIMERINRADYGYAGLMDRKGHIREEELARVLNYDNTFNNQVENLRAAINKAHRDIESENLAEMSINIKKVKGLLLALSERWRERKKEFRTLEK